MRPWIFLLLAVAGGLGAGMRFFVDGLLRGRLRTGIPWETTFINVSGSLLLGLLTGASLGHLVSSELSAILGTGFLGGYTTFSTASYETVQLIKQGRYSASFISGVGMLVLSVAAAALGVWVGAAL
ncbi:CrcB protein [Arthrobacter sp. UYP6]|uniref:fluoride efflux transporter CrcB n=1 Tax=Arthrobacter sp. UYP6 TaxID=1756378 RepID=UPI003399D2A6